MPDDRFNWTWLGADVGGREVVYRLGTTEVARLIDRLGGTWFARLDCHLDGLLRVRDCSSYEAGRKGIELWAQRHEDRLRREVQAQLDAYFARTHWRPHSEGSDKSDVTSRRSLA